MPSASSFPAHESFRVERGPVELAVWEGGDRSGPTVIFVHGYPDSHVVWDGVVAALPEHLHWVVYDVRGAGRSTRPSSRAAYRLAELSADLVAVADRVSPSKAVHVVGHDWGSIQAWEPVTDPALRGRIASFTSASGPCLDHVGLGLRSRLARPSQFGRVARQSLRSWYIGAFQLPGLAPAFWRSGLAKHVPAFLAKLEGRRVDATASSTFADDGLFGIELYRANVAPRLAKPRERIATAPVQLVVAHDDPYVGVDLFDDLPKYVPELYRRDVRGGHWHVRTHPQRFADQVAEFVDAVAAGRPPTGLARVPSPDEPRTREEHPPIRARRVKVDMAGVPLHWAGDAQTTHTANVLHLLLPAGERWFGEVFREALPFVRDARLADEMRGFVAQEAVHGRAHDVVLDHLRSQGLETKPFTDHVEWMFATFFSARPLGRDLPKVLQKPWLFLRVAGVAAVEHTTTTMGAWIIEPNGLERVSHPTMIELLRWHGAEEVEHRAVAFDAFQHLSGSFALRVGGLIPAATLMTLLWVQGVRYLMRRDPTKPGAPTFRSFVETGRAGTLPSVELVFGMLPEYLKPRHHPSRIGSLSRALEVLSEGLAAGASPGSPALRPA